jgi:hypothetical protein
MGSGSLAMSASSRDVGSSFFEGWLITESEFSISGRQGATSPFHVCLERVRDPYFFESTAQFGFIHGNLMKEQSEVSIDLRGFHATQ